jgi:hypothetical protein
VDNTLIVVLAIVIALSLGGGVYLLMSGDEEPPEPYPVTGPNGMGSAPAVPPEVVPEPAPPPAFPVPESETESEDGADSATEPAPAPVDEAAAIAKMKATLEGTTFTLEVNSMDVRSALNLIAKLADVEINTNLADSDRLDRKVSFKFDSVGILDGLEFICQMTGLKHEVGPRGIVIK